MLPSNTTRFALPKFLSQDRNEKGLEPSKFFPVQCKIYGSVRFTVRNSPTFFRIVVYPAEGDRSLATQPSLSATPVSGQAVPPVSDAVDTQSGREAVACRIAAFEPDG